MFRSIDCKSYKISICNSEHSGVELRNITHRLPSLFQSNLLMIRAIIRKQRSTLFLVTHKRWNAESTKSAGNREDTERKGKTCRYVQAKLRNPIWRSQPQNITAHPDNPAGLLICWWWDVSREIATRYVLSAWIPLGPFSTSHPRTSPDSILSVRARFLVLTEKTVDSELQDSLYRTN